MLTRARPERERDLGDGAGPVLDRHAKLVQLAALDLGLEQAPAVVARGAVPLAHGCGLARRG